MTTLNPLNNNNTNYRHYWNFLVATTLLLFLPCNVLAQTDLARSIQEARKATIGLERLRGDIQTINSDIEEFRANINTEQDRINRICSIFVDEETCFNSLEKLTHGDRARLRGWRNLRRQYRENLEAKERELANIQDNSIPSLERLSSPEVIQAHVRSLDVQTNLLEATGNLQDAERALDHIANLYDKSLLGNYLQDKFTKLLTGRPNLVCQVSRNCGGSSGQSGPDAARVRRVLFNEANPIRRGSGSGGTGVSEPANAN